MTTGEAIAPPTYIPPHLRGKVGDFRREGDGNISFSHPEAFPGMTPDSARALVTPDQFAKTFDLPSRFGNFSAAMREQYAPLQRAQTSARQINDGIANYLRKALKWSTSSQGKAVGTAGLAAALGGGLGSYAWDAYKGRDGSIGKALLMALLAGGVGAGGTAWGQSRHNRRENFLSKSASDVAVDIQRMLENDPSLSRQDRVQIIRGLMRMGEPDLNQLRQLLKTSAGVGAGVLVARFMGAKGLLPLLLSGILGGALLSGGGGGPRRNAQGQISILDYM